MRNDQRLVEGRQEKREKSGTGGRGRRDGREGQTGGRGRRERKAQRKDWEADEGGERTFTRNERFFTTTALMTYIGLWSPL